ERCKDGSLNSVITSPVYSDISTGAGGLNTKPAKHAGQQSGRQYGPSQVADQKYGDNPAQIAKLKDKGVEAVLTSPPYAESLKGYEDGRGFRQGKGCFRSSETFGSTTGQIGNLSDSSGVDSVVTSPPYADTATAKNDPKGIDLRKNWETYRAQGGGCSFEKYCEQQRKHSNGYGSTQGQIGKEFGETYWEAMNLVYRACYRSIKQGGYIAVVVKDYVKNKKRVPLCDDTLKLLTHIGFTPVERIRAMLVEEEKHDGLFGPETKRKERKSFFRRLAEKKGSPRID